MASTRAIEVRQGQGLATADEWTIEQLIDQTVKIQQAMKAVMKEGEHYGVIPGTNKPTLLKPGAEKLCLLFRFDPEYQTVSQIEEDELVSYTVICTLFHIPTGNRIASGVGQCNSHEKKYRYTWEPTEDKPTKAQAAAMKAAGQGGWRKVGLEWIWHLKADNKFALDYANTILKMAAKRALVAAVLNATAASDLFTQDLEDLDRSQRTAHEAVNVKAADPEVIDALRDDLLVAAEIDANIWGADTVLANAQRRFGRQIASLDELTSDEANMILVGVNTWLAQQPTDESDETVPAEDVQVDPETGGEDAVENDPQEAQEAEETDGDA